MKVLIVDDESHVRDAIQLLLPWDSLGFDTVLTSESVDEAVQMIQEERPELAIVDVVIGPVFGMDIMNYINDRKLNTKVVVISGHDDFQYVRAMFILGALEYLLKPIEQDKLREAVEKAVSQLHSGPEAEEEFAVDKQFKQVSPDYRHGLLRKLFRPELSARAYDELCRISQGFQSVDRCRILHCTGSTLSVHQEGYMLKVSRLVNKMQEKLEAEEKGTVFQNMKPSMDIVILIYGTGRMDFDQEILALKKLAVSENCMINLGCSRIHNFPEKLEQAWEEARVAADHIAGTGIFSVREYEQGMHRLHLKGNLQMENALLSAVILGNIVSVEERLGMWGEAVMDGQPRTVGLLRNLWESFFQMYRKWENAAETADEEILLSGTEKNFGDVLIGGSWDGVLNRMYQYFLKSTAELMESRKQILNASGMMPKVVDFLELNYMRRLSQQECADYFHMNKDYLSRAFKKHTGIGMAKYLNNIRIRKAQELLKSTDLQVMEIADQVGYFDSKYFSRQFKLATGMTPAQYRQEA
ncbi:response regulator transcription factor [Lacrimispora sp. 210928-DFI.3.58]|mgnify:CR=1 FL=1|uniref:response regulator transcription factor n=1 Tax=Lacrimispora sp. 210928-DFI.3.58 TaxID=2883214 RepID=UPI001D07D882|nr:helix-turn-helix domain-containing protein [Lacrimispora sp. 210928-DFI.3.58]MCB7318012.1 helix-turn-helix domain-containing protein [Lacrimispora sp. 210928-DFI.3.58]